MSEFLDSLTAGEPVLPRKSDRPGDRALRTRSLLRELGPDRLLEAVGVCALANTVVRLGMLAQC